MSADHLLKAHLQRLRTGTLETFDRTRLSDWVEQNTYLAGKPFSFKGHEFQKRIMNDPSQEIVIIKSAQLGVSEMSLRMALALIMTTPGAFNVGYVFPTASFSSQYMRTRLNPILQTSPALRAAVSSDDLDSGEVKTFGPNKAFYSKGAAVGNSAISTSLDCLFFDELSFSSPEVVGDYNSRLIHSAHKIKVSLSTPTFPGDPIDAAYKNSRRWLNMCKCSRCAHWFYPSYYDHVVIDGFSGHLDEITKENLHNVKRETARMVCPACGGEPDLGPEHREWVCENPDDRYLATGYRLSPFDAPAVVTIPYLVEASTSYASKSKFRQFNLGLSAEDADSGLTHEDLERVGVEMLESPFTTHVMGIDLGMVCHFVVGGVGADGRFGVVHYEKVPLARFRERYWALKAQWRVSVVCSDQYPYTDLIMGMCSEDPALYGCTYVQRQGLELFQVKQQEADFFEAQGALRQVQVNRSAIFDRLLVDIRDGRVWVRRTENWVTYKEHLMDQKRVSSTLRNGEMAAVWMKSSKGNDHWAHGTAYCWIAGQMRGVAMGFGVSLPARGVSKFKLQERLEGAQKARQLVH